MKGRKNSRFDSFWMVAWCLSYKGQDDFLD
jgi:hypothetical protein